MKNDCRKEMARCINESVEEGKNDLQEVMELLKERFGVDVKFLGKNKNIVTIGFEFSQKLKDETDKLSYSEQDRFEADLVEFLGDKVKEVFITNTKYGESSIVLRVTDDFNVGVEYYDVNALIKNADKAEKELKLEKLYEMICDKLRSKVPIHITIEKRISHKEVIDNEATIFIDSKNLVDEVGIMKSIFDVVSVSVFNSWVRANPKDGSLEAYADIHLSWHNHDGGSNGAELCTAYFSNGRWTI